MLGAQAQSSGHALADWETRGRIAHHHLADGPEWRTRDAAFAAGEPLSHSDWISANDAEQAATPDLGDEPR